MITEPTLLIDEIKAKKNIQQMVGKAARLGVELRPHFKTHQSQKIGKWFREVGVNGITVSSLKMAEYFAKDGWKDITVAFPVNPKNADRISRLTSNIQLRVLVTDEAVLPELEQSVTNSIHFYIELDPGYGRSGVPISNTDKIQELISGIETRDKFNFCGFYIHSGHSYKCRSKNEIEALITPILESLSALKEAFDYPICFGDTPSCSVLENLEPVDQISPGNFVFYDWMQVNIGSCNRAEIAVAMKCPVVGKNEDRSELLIHGGAVHFSKDFIQNEDGTKNFGVLVSESSDGWGEVIEGAFLKSVSQEHGIVSAPEDLIDSIQIGDTVTILPIHSCLTADLMGNYLTTSGDVMDHMNAKIFS